MKISHTIALIAALLLSLPAVDALANKRNGKRVDPRSYRSVKSGSKHKGKVRVRGGMVSRFKAWKQRNHRTRSRRPRSNTPRSTVKRRSTRTSRVWHKRS